MFNRGINYLILNTYNSENVVDKFAMLFKDIN